MELFKKIKWNKIGIVILGSLISAYGITLALHAGFGSGTMAVLWQGMSIQFGITLGQASFILAVIMVAITALIDRKQIHLGTVIYQVVYSVFVDIFAHCVFYTGNHWINFFIMLLGAVIFPVGLAIYSYANYGRGSYEALTFALVNRTGKSIRLVRICLDLTLVVIGMLMGGKIGLCTFCIIAMSGYIIQFTTKQLHKHFDRDESIS